MRQFEAYSAGTGGLIHGRPVDDRTSFVCFSSSSPTKQHSKRNQNLVAIDIKTSLAIWCDAFEWFLTFQKTKVLCGTSTKTLTCYTKSATNYRGMQPMPSNREKATRL
jgi:hypothetical protein